MSENVEKQVAMSAETWKQMQQNGVTDETPLLVDLFWMCDGEETAKTLAAKLPEIGVHDIATFNDDKGWMIKGQTGPRAFNLQSIQQMAREMAEFGEKHGCGFDGWGAMLTGKKPWWKFW